MILKPKNQIIRNFNEIVKLVTPLLPVSHCWSGNLFLEVAVTQHTAAGRLVSVIKHISPVASYVEPSVDYFYTTAAKQPRGQNIEHTSLCEGYNCG